jgi:hypothetical protein
MKKYAVVVHIELDGDEGFCHPVKWQFDELIGNEVTGWEVFDVTEKPVERLRIDAEGVEVIA